MLQPTSKLEPKLEPASNPKTETRTKKSRIQPPIKAPRLLKLKFLDLLKQTSKNEKPTNSNRTQTYT